MEEFESIGIATSAMLVELSISCWTGRKLDKAVSNEIDASKQLPQAFVCWQSSVGCCD